jgi:hypothetical protein
VRPRTGGASIVSFSKTAADAPLLVPWPSDKLGAPMPGSALPPPISAYREGSFGAFTIQQRLPRILADARQEFGPVGRADPRWAALEDALASGGLIDSSLFSASTQFWQERLLSLRGASWAEQSFFDLEFLFYLAINSIAHDIEPGFDVFRRARSAALHQGMPEVVRAVDEQPDISLERAIHLAVLGNKGDLSQLEHHRAGSTDSWFLMNDSARLVEALRDKPDAAIQILADNAGSELCFDLILAALLVELRPGPLILQVKPHPMFVSDALTSDVEQSIAEFIQTGGRLARLGQRLDQARRDGRFLVEAAADWGEPRHMNRLDPKLHASLCAAQLVIVKGDLNSRRFFEDRAWPADTQVAVASVAEGVQAFALRVLKSDCVVGLPSDQVAKLFATDPEWRSNSKYALIQRVDRNAGT